MKSFIKISALFFALVTSFQVYGASYVVVSKNAKVYDEPSAKYVTLNQDNMEVSPVPGMVFKTDEHTPGWFKIEYSPGLHAYIPEQFVASDIKEPQTGSYKVANNPGETVSVKKNGSEWTAVSGGKTYKGIIDGNIIIFLNDDGYPSYSLVDLGQGGMVISYDNAVTNFF